jgi:hypothetical protein
VQRWTWYTLLDYALNGSLFDSSMRLTDFGLNFANYVARFLPASPTTIFFQRGWTGYVQDCDTQIGPPDPGPRRQTLSIAADGTGKALFKFDLSVLPTDVEVISARLMLRSALHRDVGDMMVHCYGIRRPWSISERHGPMPARPRSGRCRAVLDLATGTRFRRTACWSRPITRPTLGT